MMEELLVNRSNRTTRWRHRGRLPRWMEYVSRQAVPDGGRAGRSPRTAAVVLLLVVACSGRDSEPTAGALSLDLPRGDTVILLENLGRVAVSRPATIVVFEPLGESPSPGNFLQVQAEDPQIDLALHLRIPFRGTVLKRSYRIDSKFDEERVELNFRRGETEFTGVGGTVTVELIERRLQGRLDGRMISSNRAEELRLVGRIEAPLDVTCWTPEGRGPSSPNATAYRLDVDRRTEFCRELTLSQDR